MFDIASVLVGLSALFAYLNHRYLKLPMSIGLMLISLVFSLLLVFLGSTDFSSWGLLVAQQAKEIVRSIDFNYVLMQGMLSFLLFAGALHVHIDDLSKKKWVIGILATLGVVFSTLIIGVLSYFLLHALGIEIALIYCFLFGALISPTDPIAVLGILKTVKAPKSMEIKIAGESLFNDGVAVVGFIVLLGIATGEHQPGVIDVVVLFLVEVLGGLFLGLLLGGLAYAMLKKVDDYTVEILISLALVMGGYSLATAMHVSGPIVMVIAGLLIGNRGRQALSESSREHMDTFWMLLDEILNAVLFVLIGLEVITLTFTQSWLVAGVLLVPLVLLARFVCVGIPIKLMSRWETFSPKAVQILTWGGLRGGISVALALSLPDGHERDVILVLTYIVVAFSIIVQGLTIGKLIKKSL